MAVDKRASARVLFRKRTFSRVRNPVRQGRARAAWPRRVSWQHGVRVGPLFFEVWVKTFRVGILYSTTGPYGAIGRDCRAGAEFAIEELEKAGSPVRIEPVFGDPAGQPE